MLVLEIHSIYPKVPLNPDSFLGFELPEGQVPQGLIESPAAQPAAPSYGYAA